MFDLSSNTKAPKVIPGYTGHIPKDWRESDFNKEKCTYYIPNYQGFVSGIKAENIHGKTFGEATAQALDGSYHMGINHPPQVIYKSTQQDAYEKGLQDYHFSFSRMTEAEKQQAKNELRRSMELHVPRPGIDVPQQPITTSYDEIVGSLHSTK